MPRTRTIMVGILTLLPTLPIFAQSADDLYRFEDASMAPPLHAEAWNEAGEPLPDEPHGGELPVDAEPYADSEPPADAESLIESEPPAAEPEIPPLSEFLGYHYSAGSTSWILGDGDQFGMVSLAWDHYASPGAETSFGTGMKFHFLGGPERTDMPPRVFDFSLAVQSRDQLGVFCYDVATSVMASSDFEGSSRDGIRFPSHAVGFLRVSPAAELVFGVDYLDRGDIKLLPVGGVILVPSPDLRLEVVFPRPRAVLRLTDRHRLYVAGELGGGTWAIERDALYDDLATYRDLRASIGVEAIEKDGDRTAFEIAYLFDRRLEFTSHNGDYHPDDTVMVRLVHSY